jgi:hypothetical protein
MEKANKKVEVSSKQVALAVNNVATSGFAMYNAIDRVMDMEVQVDRANLQVKTSLNAVEDAQTRYNKVVEKYGPVSAEAQAAQKDLQLAQERYQVACERADMIQGNLNETIVQSALTFIPSLITMITSVSTLMTGWTAVTQGVSAALTFLQANPIILVIAGVAALIAGIIYAYNNCKPFRDLINTIGAYLQGAFLAAWNAVSGAVSWFNTNVIQPVGQALNWLWNNVLVPLAAFLIGTLLNAWNQLSNGISWAYKNVIKPVFDAMAWVYNNVLKPIADFLSGAAAAVGAAGSAISGAVSGGALGGMPNPLTGGGGLIGGAMLPGIPHGQHGGLITRPTILLAGEAGPEALIPLNKGSHGLETVTININIAGSADRATAEYAAGLVEEKLKSIVLEASSTNAPAVHRRIRYGYGVR